MAQDHARRETSVLSRWQGGRSKLGGVLSTESGMAHGGGWELSLEGIEWKKKQKG